MGNEHSKTKSSNTSNKSIEQNGKITSNGLEIEANGEAIVQENGYTSLNFVTESTEHDIVAVVTDTPAAVISEIVETIVQKEPERQSKEEKVSGFGKMFKKKTEPPADLKVVQEKEISNDDQTDASLPATDPQPESSSTGEGVATMIIAEPREDLEYLCPQDESSTQMDNITAADIFAHFAVCTATITEGPVDVTETAAIEEDSLTDSTFVIAEEVVEQTAIEETINNKIPEIIVEEVVIENDSYENIVLTAERVEDAESVQEVGIIAEENNIEESEPQEISYSLPKVVPVCTATITEGPVDVTETAAIEEDSLTDSTYVIAEEVVEQSANEETINNKIPEIIVEVMIENDSNENMVFTEEVAESVEEVGIIAEENNIEESEPQETSSTLPKAVADTLEAVLAAESVDFADVNMSMSCVDKVITEDNDEGAENIPADVVLIETTEPESNALTPETAEAIDVFSLDDEQAATVMETISEGVPEEPNGAPTIQEMTVEELPTLLVTDIQVNEESAPEEVTAAVDDAVAIEDAAGISEQKLTIMTDVGSSEKWEEFNAMEILYNQLITIEELPEDSPDDEVMPEYITDVMTTDDKAAVCEDVLADVGPETVEEAEPSPAIVNQEADLILEAAINVLSQEFELCTMTSEEAAVDYGITTTVVEDVIVPTVYVLFYEEIEESLTISEEPPKATENLCEEPAVDCGITMGEEVTVETVSIPLSEATEETLTIPEESVKATEHIFEEPSDVPQMDTTDDPEPCVEDVKAVSVPFSEENLPIQEELPKAQKIPVKKSAVDCGMNLEEEVSVETSTISLSEEIEESLTIPQKPPKATENIVEEPDVDCEVALEERVIIETVTVTLSEGIEESVTIREESAKATENIADEPADVPTMDTTVDPEPCVEDIETVTVTLSEEIKESLTIPEDQPKATKTIVEEPALDCGMTMEEEVIVETRSVPLPEGIEESLTMQEPPNAAENMVEDLADMPPMDVTEEPESCVEHADMEKIVRLLEQQSQTDSTLDSKSAEITEASPARNTDIEALLYKLQSVCTSVVQESAYKLGSLEMSSQGYRIVLTIKVEIKKELL